MLTIYVHDLDMILTNEIKLDMVTRNVHSQSHTKRKLWPKNVNETECSISRQTDQQRLHKKLRAKMNW
jgi:hypothetical protein